MPPKDEHGPADEQVRDEQVRGDGLTDEELEKAAGGTIAVFPPSLPGRDGPIFDFPDIGRNRPL